MAGLVILLPATGSLHMLGGDNPALIHRVLMDVAMQGTDGEAPGGGAIQDDP